MARRSVASPLATFLDYILTAPIAEGKAALEASIAALGARQWGLLDAGVAPEARTRRRAAVAADVAATAVTTPVVAPPASLPPTGKKRGRPKKVGTAIAPSSAGRVLQGPGGTSTPPQPNVPQPTRRRRPPVDAAPTTSTTSTTSAAPVAPVVNEVPPPTVPLPDQTVDREADAVDLALEGVE